MTLLQTPTIPGAPIPGQDRPLLVAFSGSTSRPSRTTALVTRLARAAAAAHGLRVEIVDLHRPEGADLPLEILTARIAERLRAADALILATPVMQGSYAGLFKHVLDQLEPLALRERPVLLASVGGGQRHALVVESLRPVLGFFEATTLATALHAGAADLAADGTPSAELEDRLHRAVAQFGPHLPPRPVPAPHPDNRAVLDALLSGL